MKYIKLITFLVALISFQAFAIGNLQVSKVVTVDDEVFSILDIKTVYFVPARFDEKEVASVVLIDGRIIHQNEIKTIEFIKKPLERIPRRDMQLDNFDFNGKPPVIRMGPPNFDIPVLRRGGTDAGGG